jgi:hypothetical protein
MWCALALLSIDALVVLAPKMPTGDLESSWGYALNVAAAQRLVFGRDIVFTFGPYASISTRLYSPFTLRSMEFGGLFLGVLFFACLAWLTEDTRGNWLTISILILTVLEQPEYYPDAFFFCLPLLVSLALFKLQTAAGKDALRKKSTVTLILLAFAGIGLLPLVKLTLLPLVACVCLACAVFLAANGRKIVALACLAATGLSMGVLWVVAGQPLRALPWYVASAQPVIAGYSEAMSMDGPRLELLVFLAGAAAVLICIAAKNGWAKSEKGFLLPIFSLFLFLAFKEGFVRQDTHSLAAMNCLAFSCAFLLLLDAGPRPSPWRRTLLAVAIVAMVFTGTVEWRIHFNDELVQVDRSLVKNPGEPRVEWLRRLVKEVGYRKFMAMSLEALPRGGVAVSWPEDWGKEFWASNRAINESSGLNFNLPGTVDIYSYQQSSLLARGYRWNPRPVLQSYGAYTPELIRRDEQHLRSSMAPDHLIFNLESIDNHFPSLDDGLSWPAMLDNYGVSDSNGNWVLLNRKNGMLKRASVYIPLETVTAQLGQEISMPEADGPVFIQVHVTLSRLGKLINLLYKVSPLSIRVTEWDGKESLYRVNANMMDTGFILSPLVTTNDDFVKLFDPDCSRCMRNRIKSFALEVSGGNPTAWNKTYTATLEQYKY